MELLKLVIAALLAAATTASQLPTPTHPPPAEQPGYREGKGTRYYQGLMQTVAENRGLTLGWASGFATYPDCKKIGQYMRVSVRDPRTMLWSGWEWKRITDCSEYVDYDRHVAEGLVELSWEDALRLGYAYEGRTRIRFYPPRP